MVLTHWGRVTHICVVNLTTIDSDNGMSPGRRQAIIWTNAGILLIRTWRTNFSEILIDIHIFSNAFENVVWKMWAILFRPQCVNHYSDVIMGAMAYQITSLTIANLTFYSGTDQRKHQSSASMAFVSAVNSPHKGPVIRKMFPFDDVIILSSNISMAQCKTTITPVR